MPEILEKSASLVPEPKEQPPQDKQPVTIRAILLFDGTMNNKTNIESRETQNEFYQKTRRKKFLVFGKRIGDGGTSYENGRTNIVALDSKLLNESAEDFDLTIPVYTEGAGTINNAKDRTFGFAMGVGVAGVKAKCEKGINELLDKLFEQKINGEEINCDLHYIKNLTIDLFGFSRGAATARYAVHRLLTSDNSIIRRLQLRGFDIADTQVEVCFVGLFDTVSSHGVSFDDVESLHLGAINKAKTVLHLAAADEHRKNFSLTHIRSSCENGKEFYLPGVHSDVGGSYHDLSHEGFSLDSKTNELVKVNFYLNTGTPEAIRQDMHNLIADNWYTPDQIEYEEISMDHGSYAQIKAYRKDIRNAYCNIPLKIMAKEAVTEGIPIKQTLELEANGLIQECNCPYLTDLDQRIDAYKFTRIEDYPWRDPLLKAVRNRHFHMSAKDSIGLKPRFKANPPTKFRTDKVRWRQEYDG